MNFTGHTLVPPPPVSQLDLSSGRTRPLDFRNDLIGGARIPPFAEHGAERLLLLGNAVLRIMSNSERPDTT